MTALLLTSSIFYIVKACGTTKFFMHHVSIEAGRVSMCVCILLYVVRNVLLDRLLRPALGKILCSEP